MAGAEFRLELDTEQKRSLLAQLNDAHRRGRLARNSRIYFHLLQAAAYALPAVFLLSFFLSALSRAANSGWPALPRVCTLASTTASPT